MQDSDIVPTLFIILVINLRIIGLTNHNTKYDDDTCLLVPGKAHIDIIKDMWHILK